MKIERTYLAKYIIPEKIKGLIHYFLRIEKRKVHGSDKKIYVEITILSLLRLSYYKG